MVQLVEDQLDIDTYMELREAVHFPKLSRDQARRGLDNSLYTLVAFKDGKADFVKGVYDQKYYVFHQGPNDGEWGASDHSGEYSVTVGQFSRFNSSDNPQYIGDLTIDGATTTYKLEVMSDMMRLTLDKDNTMDLIFTAKSE